MHGAEIVDRLRAGNIDTAKFIGLPLELFAARPAGPLDVDAQAMLQPLIDKAALTLSINDAWAMLAILTVAALTCIPFARKSAK